MDAHADTNSHTIGSEKKRGWFKNKRTSISEIIQKSANSLSLASFISAKSTESTNQKFFSLGNFTEFTSESMKETPIIQLKRLLPLHKAVYTGNSRKLINLINSSDLNELDPIHGISALHLAVEMGNIILTRILLMGSEENSQNSKPTPTADPNIQNFNGRTCLMIAAIQENSEIIDFLLKCNADVNIKDFSGCSVLHYSLLTENTNDFRKFLEKNADIDVIDNSGKTLLHHAIIRNKTRFATFLISCGCNIDAMDLNQRTPLHFSVISNMKSVIFNLLEKGANTKVRDNDGKIPFDYIDYKNFDQEISDYLTKFAETQTSSIHSPELESFTEKITSQTESDPISAHKSSSTALLRVLNPDIDSDDISDVISFDMEILELDEKIIPILENDSKYNDESKNGLGLKMSSENLPQDKNYLVNLNQDIIVSPIITIEDSFLDNSQAEITLGNISAINYESSNHDNSFYTALDENTSTIQRNSDFTKQDFYEDEESIFPLQIDEEDIILELEHTPVLECQPTYSVKCEKCESFNMTVKDLSDKVDHLNSKDQLLQNELKQTKTKNHELKATINEMKTNEQQRNEEIDRHFQNQREKDVKFQNQIESAIFENKELKNTIKTQNENLSELQLLKEQVETEKQFRQELEGQNRILLEKANHLEESVQLVKLEREKEIQSLEKSKISEKELHTTIELLQQHLSEARELCSDKDKNNMLLKENISKKETEISELTLKDLNTGLLQTEIDALKSDNEILKNELVNIESNLIILQNTLLNKELENTSLLEKNTELNSKINALQLTINDLKYQLENQKKESGILNQKLNEDINNFKINNQLINSKFTTELSEHQKAIENYEAKIENLEAKHTLNINEYKAQISNLIESDISSKILLEKLETEVKENDAIINFLNNKIKNMNEDLIRLNKEEENSCDRSQAILNNNSYLQNENNTLKAELKKLNNEIGSISKNIEKEFSFGIQTDRNTLEGVNQKLTLISEHLGIGMKTLDRGNTDLNIIQENPLPSTNSKEILKEKYLMDSMELFDIPRINTISRNEKSAVIYREGLFSKRDIRTVDLKLLSPKVAMILLRRSNGVS